MPTGCLLQRQSIRINGPRCRKLCLEFLTLHGSNQLPHLMCRSKGGGAVGPDPPPHPLKNHKKYWVFLSNTGPDSPKIRKLPSQHSILGHYQHADDGPLVVVFAWTVSSLYKQTNKPCQSLIPSDKTFWIRPCTYRG